MSAPLAVNSSAFHAPLDALQDAANTNLAEETAKEHDVRQFAPRDSHGLTNSQRDAVDRVYAGLNALQVNLNHQHLHAST